MPGMVLARRTAAVITNGPAAAVRLPCTTANSELAARGMAGSWCSGALVLTSAAYETMIPQGVSA